MPEVWTSFKEPRKKKPSRASLDRKWSLAVRKRDGFKCQFPGCKEERRLEAHHICTRKQRPDLIHEVSNGVTLCHYHHIEVIHKNAAVGETLGFVSHERYELARNEQR